MTRDSLHWVEKIADALGKLADSLLAARNIDDTIAAKTEFRRTLHRLGIDYGEIETMISGAAA